MFIRLLIIGILINIYLSADDSNLNTNKSIKKNNEIERGFAYGNEKYKEKITDEPLMQIIKLLKEQLQVQKEIRDILKNEYEPEPKIILNSKGEECIENSSADCFKMPIIAEARKVPVIKDWMEKGDLQSSVNFLQWQSKYFDEISKRAYNNVAAINQFGDEAYPINYNTMGYENATGYASGTLKRKIEKAVLEKHLDEVNFIYFIGENEDADLYAMDNIVKFLKQYGSKIKLQFIFKNEKSFKSFQIAGEHNKEFMILNNYKMSVNPEEFSNFNIHNSPSLVAINKKEKTAQTVLVGRASENRTNKMIIMYLRNQGILEDKELNIDKGWKENSDYGKRYIEKLLGADYLKKIDEEK